jgi:hypothetical protein
MFTRRGQVRAVGGTADLDQPLGAAADGANLLVECRTMAARLSPAAQRTKHNRSIV